ncbi:hypothetical protein NIE88_17265 [Sporolactobacillus shoreicorticis]|uniref:Uncharacterized protein n=1 Tax=Sporolactobacillus shoreicorticis TaxID=1923877 RepID=A0ABW5S000_9BACL|nr:hypothetical protein [Sporolactobacillus shoreicorticis]MCO7127509.1 hypothetical protein [Sporolactobacillus shoreicorticis]
MKELFDHYAKNDQDRTVAAALASLILYVVIGIGKLVLGMYLLSTWYVINAVYYLILCIARGQAIKKYKIIRSIENRIKRYDLEFVVYKRSGIFICLLGISYFFTCLRMYLIGDATVYGGYMVYLVATIAFTKMGFAIHGAVINRHRNNPIISTLKIISFIDATVAIVVTQYTLLIKQSSAHAMNSSALFGMGCSALFILIGIRMLNKKKKYPVL